MEANIKLWEDVYRWNRDNANYLIYPDEEVIRIVKKFFLPHGVSSVLDAGCGAGRHSLAMLREGLHVTSLDSSASALEITRNLAGTAFPVRCHQSTIAELPFADASFDAVLCWGVLHYLEEAEFRRAINEFYRVLKPGGVFALTLRSIEDSECDPAALDRMQQSSAFESKAMSFRYFAEDGIAPVLQGFTNIRHGHKTRTTFEDPHRRMAHWFIVAEKPAA
jgi:ubiquinone/menaquinone biosynthesis C-methylase UbiE